MTVPLLTGLTMSSTHRFVSADAQVQAPLVQIQDLREQLRLRGDDVDDPAWWRAQVLLVASDLLGVGENAFSCLGNCAMVLAATLNRPPTDPLTLTLAHAGGWNGQVRLVFGDAGEAPAAEANPAAVGMGGQPPWVTCEALVESEVLSAVRTVNGRLGNQKDGAIAGLVATGAALAMLQALAQTNATTASFKVNGLGNDRTGRNDISLSVSILPAPRPTLKRRGGVRV